MVVKHCEETSHCNQLTLFGTLGQGGTSSQWAPGTITFDGREYRYTGFVLDLAAPGADCYLPKTFVFSPDDAGVEPACDPERVCAMLDKVGRDRKRQQEIATYGRRIWHSPYRPEGVAQQALDFAFWHDIALVAKVLPYVHAFYQSLPAEADVWTCELKHAYSAYCRWYEQQELVRLLSSRGVPASVVVEL